MSSAVVNVPGLVTAPGGDADIAAVAALFGEPSRARVLAALVDGRALPASALAAEAGVSAPAMSAHLAKLLDSGLVTVEPSGRHRYYRLAGPRVAAVLEAMAALAPQRRITSLRQGTKAEALRRARTCYDHLAGRLGSAVTAALLDAGALQPVDGNLCTDRRPGDPLAAAVPYGNEAYRLGERAATVFAGLGVDLDAAVAAADRTGRPPLRFCVDWTEQRHHLAGHLGSELCRTFVDRGWIERVPQQRAVRVTEAGRAGFTAELGIAAG